MLQEVLRNASWLLKMKFYFMLFFFWNFEYWKWFYRTKQPEVIQSTVTWSTMSRVMQIRHEAMRWLPTRVTEGSFLLLNVEQNSCFCRFSCIHQTCQVCQTDSRDCKEQMLFLANSDTTVFDLWSKWARHLIFSRKTSDLCFKKKKKCFNKCL